MNFLLCSIRLRKTQGEFKLKNCDASQLSVFLRTAKALGQIREWSVQNGTVATTKFYIKDDFTNQIH